MENIRNSFPEKTENDCTDIAKKFYKHLTYTIVEGLKIFTLSKKQLERHVQCVNPEIPNAYFDQGKNIIIAVGHYNSWEMILTGLNTFFKATAVVIYSPVKNRFLDQKLINARSRQGTRMLPVREVKSFFSTASDQLYATFFAIDQSPSNPAKSYWLKFLNQDTAVFFGTEHYAKAFNLPVIYSRLIKVKRGYYQIEFVEVTNDPVNTAYGEITEKVTGLLEKDIIAQPEYWLWSHRRWKHKKHGA